MINETEAKAANEGAMDCELITNPLTAKIIQEPGANPLDVLSNLPADILLAIPVEQIDEIECTSSGDNNDGQAFNTFDLKLKTSALAVQMQTKTAISPVIAELTTKLELSTTRLEETENRLMNAIYRIGYLESQLEAKDKLIEELRSK